MTRVRGANTSCLDFSANCHKSALPNFVRIIMPRNWQFAVKWRPNRSSVKRTWVSLLPVHRITVFTISSYQCWKSGSGSGSEVIRIPERARQFVVGSFQTRIQIWFRAVAKGSNLRTIFLHLWMNYCTARSMKTSDFLTEKRDREPYFRPNLLGIPRSFNLVALSL
jgi:hypothetical protein